MGWKEDDLKHVLDKYGSVDYVDDRGASLLMIANIRKNLPRMEVLLENHADHTYQDLKGNTVLHYARSPEIAELLVRHGADPFIKNNQDVLPHDNHYDYNNQDIGDFVKAAYEKKHLETLLDLPSEWNADVIYVLSKGNDAVGNCAKDFLGVYKYKATSIAKIVVDELDKLMQDKGYYYNPSELKDKLYISNGDFKGLSMKEKEKVSEPKKRIKL